EAICVKAMAVTPHARYSSAIELARDVERYLADGPVSAYPEPWTSRAARWGRRHKPLVTGAAGLLLAGLGGGAGGTIWYQNVQAERHAQELLLAAERTARSEQLKTKVAVALDEAEKLRQILAGRLGDPDEARVLLSEIDEWGRLVTSARASWNQARD